MQILDRLKIFEQIQSPIIIIGPNNSGKYQFVRYFANTFINEEPILINLKEDDIYGQFSVTETPGKFTFSKSILTKAIETGKVVCCKNIENLSIDCLSNINQLITAIKKNQQEFLTNNNYKIKIHQNFRIFLTCKENSQILKLIDNTYYQIKINQLQEQQIEQIIQNFCQESISTCLMWIQKDIYEKIQFEITLQQMIDIGKRLQRDYDNKQLKLNNAFQVHKMLNSLNQSDKLLFCLEIYERCILQLSKEEIDKYITYMGILLHMNKDELKFYLNNRKVVNQINLTKNQLIVGRTYQYRYRMDQFSYNDIKNLSLTNYTNNLIEKIIVSLQNNERPLLVAKTGIGKTYTLGLLGKAIGQDLTVINLSRNTDVSELTGGWKPTSQDNYIQSQQDQLIKTIDYLSETYLDMQNQQNQQFCQLIKSNILQNNTQQLTKQLSKLLLALQQHKNNSYVQNLQEFYNYLISNKSNYNFQYIEGPLIQAADQGNILLLDEINMANDEVLQYIQYFIGNDYIEKFDKQSGQIIRKQKHLNFKVVAAMNPGTDIGKKELPITLKQMFTTMNIEEMNQDDDLLQLIETYIGKQQLSKQILNLFKELQKNVYKFQTISQQSVCYSIRQLCRALMFIQKFPQQAYNGFMLYFGSQLGKQSKDQLIQYLKQYLGDQCDQYQRVQYKVEITPYLLQNTFLVNVIDGIQFPVGPLFDEAKYDLSKSLVEQDNSYIITLSNRQQIKSVLLSLIAGTSILLQGVTSSGKSSVIKYLAKLLGYKLTRLNNHQNTELSDYLGTYQPTKTGSLAFQYGPLVNCMINGEWILLDELNLCSSEILESLNRLLDDNHEIYIAETNEIIHPKPGFALFATQNPSGVIGNQTYGGRNMLSDAFVNRFNLIEFNEATSDELKFILSNRRQSRLLPPRFINIIIEIIQNLRLRLAHTLNSIDSDITPQIITLRDVFKIADSMPDSIQNLAISLYIVLCERQRSQQTKNEIIQEINKNCNTNLSEEFMQNYYEQQIDSIKNIIIQQYPNIAFTQQLSKMLFLALYCHKNKNNLLLISEAGCGKTQAIQIIQNLYQQGFNFINLHKNSDSSELIGQIKPVENQHLIEKRINQLLNNQQFLSEEDMNYELEQLKTIKNQIFQFTYGPLTRTIFQDQQILLDEINLANDAVIERLNSLFEYERELMLQESNEQILIKPGTTFDIYATMNPGNDYGKKELSPAMRSRMLEVYVVNMKKQDVNLILKQKNSEICIDGIKIEDYIADFYEKLKILLQTQFSSFRITYSVRDVILLFEMIRKTFKTQKLISNQQFKDVFQLTFFDGLKLRCPQLQIEEIKQLQDTVYEILDIEKVEQKEIQRRIELQEDGIHFVENNELKYIIKYGNSYDKSLSEETFNNYSLNAPTTQYNAFRVAACITSGINKNILIESDPGVGKTSLIQTLADISGNKLIRINLSEHIELSDLLGQEIPNDDKSQPFKYQIGPLSQAIIEDSWVLLDEINLANQQVLEGLNSLLDFRGSIFIPEIQQQLTLKDNFRLFAAQNSPTQKAGRKQLPQSFMNRFLTLYLYPLLKEDYTFIVNNLKFQDEEKQKLLNLLFKLQDSVNKTCCFIGGPWEINMRDLYRLYDIINKNGNQNLKEILILLFTMRFRSIEDYEQIYQIIDSVFSDLSIQFPLLSIQNQKIYLGNTYMGQYQNNSQLTVMSSNYLILKQLKQLLSTKIPLLFTTQSDSNLIDQILDEYSLLTSTPLNTIDFSKQSDISQIVGQYVYQDSQFRWQWSDLIQKMQQPGILHLKNVNFCSFAVLDRLNSILERNGSLIVFESGFTQKISQHENFRFILSFNSEFGEISSPIRNRCVEISKESIEWINIKTIQNQFKVIGDVTIEKKFDSLCKSNFWCEKYENSEQIAKFQEKMNFNVKILYPNAIKLKADSSILRQESKQRLNYLKQIFKQSIHQKIIQLQQDQNQGYMNKNDIINEIKNIFNDLQMILTYEYVIQDKSIDYNEQQQILSKVQQTYYEYNDILYCRQIIDRMSNKEKYQILDQQLNKFYKQLDIKQEDLQIIKSLIKQQYQISQIQKISNFDNKFKENMIQQILFCNNIQQQNLFNVMKQQNINILNQYGNLVQVNQINDYIHDIQQLYNYNINNWNITQKQLDLIKQSVIQNLYLFDNSQDYSQFTTDQIIQCIKQQLQQYNFSNIIDKSLLNKLTLDIYKETVQSLELSIKCLIECNCVQYGMKFIVDNDLRQSIIDYQKEIENKMTELKQQTSQIKEQTNYIQHVHNLTQNLDNIISKTEQFGQSLLNSLQNLVKQLLSTQNYAIIDHWFDISIQLLLLCMLIMINMVKQVEDYINEKSENNIFNKRNQQIDIQYIVEFAQNINQEEIMKLQQIIQKNQLIKSKYEQEVNDQKLLKDIQRIFKYDKENDQECEEESEDEIQDNQSILETSRKILAQYNLIQLEDNQFKEIQQLSQDLTQLVQSENKEWHIYSLQQYILKQLYNNLSYQQNKQLSKKDSVDIYNIPNIQLTLQTCEISKYIKQFTQQLLDEYENNNILLTIQEQIQYFESRNIFKLSCIENLKFLENMYRNINDWNQKAPKKLNYNVKELQKLIIKLRKLELFSWQKFMKKIQEDTDNLVISELSNFIYGIIKACKSEQYYDLSNQLQTSYFQLQQGQIDIFMKIIQFLIQLTQQLQNSQVQNQLQYVSEVNKELKLFYCKIQPISYTIQNNLNEKEKPITKRFISQIKLFKYDIRNFYRLRDDVELSHKSVVKLLQQFKEIIQQGVYQEFKIFQQQHEKIQKPDDKLINFLKQQDDQQKQQIISNIKHLHDEKLKLKQLELMFSQILIDLKQQNNNLDNNQIINYLIEYNQNIYVSYIIYFYYQIQQLIQSNQVQIDVQPKINQIQECINSQLNTLQFLFINQQIRTKYEVQQQIKLLNQQLLDQLQCIQQLYSYKLTDMNEKLLNDIKTLKQKIIKKEQYQNIIQNLQQSLLLLEKDFNWQIVQPHRIVYNQILDLFNQIDFNQIYVNQEHIITEQQNYQLLYVSYILQSLYSVLKSGYLPYQEQKQQKQKQQKEQAGTGLGEGEAENDITEQVKQENLNEDQLLGDKNQDNQQEQDTQQQNDQEQSGISMDNLETGDNQSIQEEQSEKENDLDREMTDQQQQNLEQADQMSQSDDIQNKEQIDNVEGNQNEDQENNQDDQYSDSEDNQEQQLQEIQSSQESIDNSLSINDEQFDNQDEQDDQDEDNHELSDLFDNMFKEDIEQEQIDQSQQNSITFDEEQLSQVDQKSSENEDYDEQQNEQQNQQEISQQDDNSEQIQKDQIENSDSFKADIQEEEQAQQGNEQQNNQSETNKQQHKQGDKGDINDENDKDENQEQEILEQKEIEEVNEDEQLTDAEQNDQGYVRDENAQQQMKINDMTVIQQQKKDEEEKEEQSKDEDVIINLPQAQINISELYNCQETQSKAFLLKTKLNVILSPTEANQLVGDFKTGKKINMKRMVQFFASNFRKDKIWLRRQKAEEKKYNIIMAIDNSFSIQQQPEIAQQLIQSLFIIQKAFKDFGQLQIYQFGDQIKQLQQENEIGVYKYLEQIKQQITFNDKTTDFKQLFEIVVEQFKKSIINMNNIFILLTDGRINKYQQEINSLYRQLIHEYRVIPIIVLFDYQLLKLKSYSFIMENGKRTIKNTNYLENNYPLLNYVICDQQQDIVDVLINSIITYLGK